MPLGSYFSINYLQWLCIFIIVNTLCTCNWIREYEVFSCHNMNSTNFINYIISSAIKNSLLFHFLADHKGIFASVYGIQVIYVAQLATVNHKMWLLQSWLQNVKSKPCASHYKNSWTGYCPNYCKHIKNKVSLFMQNK
jgi:hypothetical protein